MKQLLTSLFLTLTVIVCSSFKAEETPLEKLLKQLAKITETYPQEKVHLHVDKPYYALGEDIWIKAYVITAEKNLPSSLSAVLYVDLIDPQNEIKKMTKLEIVNGFADGNINVTDSLLPGNYRIRAYTNYMRNYDEGFFFQKTLTIGSVMDVAATAPKTQENLTFDVQFFPEGGYMLHGIRSKIGVKAVSSDGMGANLTGQIVNQNKEKVALFTTEHAGMGVFALLPKPGEKYRAIVTLPNGEEKSFKLPDALESGFTFAINATNENFNVRVGASKDKISEEEMFVVAQANGVTYASFAFKPNNQNTSANIPLKNFPTGIVHFTLFNTKSEAIAERLVFVNHHDQLNINIGNAGATTRSKSELELKVTEANGNPIDGNFSVAITDLGKVPFEEDDQVTILSNLLLTSELKGYIERPNYYFHNSTEEKERQLDNLLLTQGWRRFIWQDIVSAKEPEITFRPELTLEITGKVTNEYGKILPNARVSLFSLTRGLILKLDTITDAKGNFVFDRLDLPDTADLMLQAKIKKDFRGINLTLNKSPKVTAAQLFGRSTNIAPYLESTKERFEELRGSGIMLNTVTISKKRNLGSPLNVKNSANASGSVDYLIKADQLEKEFNIYTVFYKVPRVIVRGKFVFKSGGNRSLTNNPPMLLIIDGVQINQAEMPDFLSTINPRDVEGIEVLTSDYNTSVLGPDASGGAIYITTKGGLGAASRATNNAKVKDAGFSAKKEFYIPNYDDPKTDRQMADLRSTIYWNPTVKTDADGLAKFSFFNAGTPGTYQVTIEGMDDFGNLGRKVYTYEVK
ncbi:TonB-dependent receptor plug domain-containing protein [Pedobacter insulae]|uniref:TonB-dependent Receptor Plug Domain n=1 Tax=Pedobacter insulae TaxID=414048 RepID=A0A1I2TE77_9SPHI|nr:TonB-dependent receptor plug domain-containing protein [Pedobacter insulae]SFG60621.1 TonB-dependent Receptor Plug Domain [Pedobacter insulae]